jgi:superfamily II DNA or RNA helicase
MVYRSSFSQHMLYYRCARMWYYQKILKILIDGDLSYADAGNVIHDTLENWYLNTFKDEQEAKIFMKQKWLLFNLQDSEVFAKKGITDKLYWDMCVNGINKKLHVTHTELPIQFDDIYAKLDIVDADNLTISDWKSSKREPYNGVIHNEIEYSRQLMLYAWLYQRKFGVLVKKLTVYYLRYNGEKGELVIYPTQNDIDKVKEWYYDILKDMEYYANKKQIPQKCSECFNFCPYKEKCHNDIIKEQAEFLNHNVDNLLRFRIDTYGNYIQLKGPVSKILSKQLGKKFSYELKNAYWIRKKRPQYDGIVRFWNKVKCSLPIGFKKGLIKTLNDYAKYKKMALIINEKDYRKFNDEEIYMPGNFINGVELRSYQTQAVDTVIENKICILEIGTGGGKTEIFTEIIRRLGMKTLVIVDKVELLRQTKKRIENSLGIDVGQIGSGVKDFKDTTVATIQTIHRIINSKKKEDMFKKQDMIKYLKSVRLVIFDECHKVAARSFYRVGHYLKNTEYRLGVSGTAFRDDGNDMMINAIVGYKEFELSSKKLIKDGWLVKPSITFYKNYMTKEKVNELDRNCQKGLINEVPKYHNYYDAFIVNNCFRNNLIKDLVEENKGKKILILTKLIKHGEILNELIEDSFYINGSTGKQERKKKFDEFTNGDLNILIGTISIFSEGIDIPALDGVINASANRGNIKTVQVLGRVLRLMEGKNNAFYLDFYDPINFFRVASLARMKILRQEGHEVNIKDIKNQ